MNLMNSQLVKTTTRLLLTILLLSTNISLCLSDEKDSTNFSFIKGSLEILSKEPSWVALLGGKAKTTKSKKHYARTEDGKDFYLQDKPSHDWLKKRWNYHCKKSCIMNRGIYFYAIIREEVYGLLINLIYPIKKLILITVQRCWSGLISS